MSNYVLGALDRIDMLSWPQVTMLFLLLVAAAGLLVWMNFVEGNDENV